MAGSTISKTMISGTCGKFSKSESGMVIVEATFVFPVMFIILFFLIFMGNAFYEKAYIEDLVSRQALKGAEYCADPMLEEIKKNNGAIPSLKNANYDPYRYFFGGMDKIETEIRNNLVNEINDKGYSGFKNMQPEIITPQSNIAKFNNNVIYSTFSVEVEYKIKFPIKFLFTDSTEILTISSRAEVPVNDTAELIRNTDMVDDYLQDFGVKKKISGVFGKINSFLRSLGKK